MGNYRKHLSGAASFCSFVPTLLRDVKITHTQEFDNLISEASMALSQLSERELSTEQLNQLARKEAEYSCKLAMGVQPVLFEFLDTTLADNKELQEDTDNLLHATHYAIKALDELPISSRLLKNAHYLMCSSERYSKKYPGEFRNSPTWIGKKGSTLKSAFFVPPVDDDMTIAISDLEKYINYEETENPLVRAALIHYQLEMIHPFIDGNGRVGRLLNTMFLMQQGLLKEPVLQLSKVLHRHSDQYYMELQFVHETACYERWAAFFITMLAEAARA